MRWLLVILAVLLVIFQYRLWIGEGSLAQKVSLERKVAQQRLENERHRERNRVLAVEVEDLKEGLDSIEERARGDLGMIKKGETFYMVVEPGKNP